MNKFAQVIAWLEQGPGTCYQIAEDTGISRDYVFNCLSRLKGMRLAYRAGFVATEGMPRTVWAVGDKPDAERKPYTAKEMRQRHAAKKADLSFIGMLMR